MNHYTSWNIAETIYHSSVSLEIIFQNTEWKCVTDCIYNRAPESKFRTRYLPPPKKKYLAGKIICFPFQKTKKKLGKTFRNSKLPPNWKNLWDFFLSAKRKTGRAEKKSWSVKLFQCGLNYSWWILFFLFYFSRRKNCLDRSMMSFEFLFSFIFRQRENRGARKFNKMLEESYLPLSLPLFLKRYYN